MMRKGIRLRGWAAVASVLLALSAPGAGSAQELADFDYENLSFRGFGFFGGKIFPTAVKSTGVYGVRADLGFLGPGVRIMPSVSYWGSEMKDDEIRELEESVERLIEQQFPGSLPEPVNLGTIDRSDLVIGMDAHVVWRVSYGFLTYAGAGASAHFLGGDGVAVNGTFVEDLLDSVTAGFNVHGGLEFPITDWLRIFSEGRLEVLSDLFYPTVNFGIQFFTGTPVPGEAG